MINQQLLQASTLLDAAIAAGTVLRGKWTDEDEGRHRACLLASMVPACGAAKSADACPATVIPPWLAHLTPWIDDNCSLTSWSSTIRQYADLLRNSAELSPEQWRRLDFRVRCIALAEAMAHTTNVDVLDVCAEVAALLDLQLSGTEISDDEWATARAATTRTARAARAAWTAAGAAAWTAAGAAAGAAAVAWAAAVGAAEAARAAVGGAEAAVGSAVGGAEAAVGAADRIIAEFFAVWRQEIET